MSEPTQNEPAAPEWTCNHDPVGHNDGPCCAVCSIGEELDRARAELAASNAARHKEWAEFVDRIEQVRVDLVAAERRAEAAEKERDEALAAMASDGADAVKDNAILRARIAELEAALSALVAGVRASCETKDPECWCPIEHPLTTGHITRCMILRSVIEAANRVGLFEKRDGATFDVAAGLRNLGWQPAPPPGEASGESR